MWIAANSGQKSNSRDPMRRNLNLNLPTVSRRGKKDTTVWGDTDLTGLPFQLAPSAQSAARKIVVSYRDLDEQHTTLEGSMKYKVGKTDLRLSLISEKTDDLDTRYRRAFSRRDHSLVRRQPQQYQ